MNCKLKLGLIKITLALAPVLLATSANRFSVTNSLYISAYSSASMESIVWRAASFASLVTHTSHVFVNLKQGKKP